MRFAASLAILLTVSASSASAENFVYQQDFTGAKTDDVPADLTVLDGQFAVKEESGNKFLELPGSPLETYGVVFGPNQAAGLEVRARIRGTKTGRKFPTLAAGLNGPSGYKLRVVPAKGNVELVRGEDVLVSVPFAWKSGEWTHFRLHAIKSGAAVTVEGKVWQGDEEPKEWTTSTNDKEPLRAGKSGVWGLPFSGTPIQFDDLKVVSVE